MSFSKRAQELKEHVRASAYRCALHNPTARSSALHPSCGDEVVFSVRVHEGVIVEIGVLGEGCLLSQAAAVLAAQYVHNKLVTEVAGLSDDLLISLLNIGHVGPTRRQCISLVTQALKQLFS